MADKTGIEWTDATWNPVTGCTEVSPGCDRCYAKTFAERWRGTPGHHFENGFDVTLRPERLVQPIRWKRPRRIFVNSMSDLFHDEVSDGYIAEVFSVMARAEQHTFQVLTKRHGRMRSLLNRPSFRDNLAMWGRPWPLPNVWLGVSVESQQWADIRIPALIETPAAVRFLSCEPLLGPVELKAHWLRPTFPGPRVDWVIVGGESGAGARPMHPQWARTLRDQCAGAGVPFHFKQWGNWRPEPLYETTERYHVVQVDGRDRGKPWRGWKIDQPRAVVMERVGKGKAGRELDGRTWDEYPGRAAEPIAHLRDGEQP